MLWATRHIVIALHPKLCGLVGLGPPSWGGYNTSTGSTLLIQKSAPGLLTPCCSWQEQHGAKIHTLYWTQSILGVVFSPHPLDHLSACSRKFVSFVRSGTGWGRGWSAGVVENQQFIYVQWLLTLSSDLEPEKDASSHLTSCPARKVITSHWSRAILISNISDGEEKHNGALLFILDNGKWPSQSEEASAKVLKRGGAEESLPPLLYHFFLPTYKALPWRGKPLPTLPPVPFLFVQ